MNILKRQSFFSIQCKVKSIYRPSLRISCLNYPSFSHTTLKSFPSPKNEVYDNYMKQTSKSEKKLFSFFGDKNVPFDITIKEIEASGLKAMLQSKVPLCYFLLTLLEDYCSENLFFFLEARQFENNLSLSREEQKENVIDIYNSYLSRKSWLEINIDEKLHNDIQNFIQCINNNTPQEAISKCFKGARHSVYHLMEGSYAKFIKSDAYTIMKNELGTRIYDENDKINAVSRLRDYVVKTSEYLLQAIKDNPTNPLYANNARYHEKITILIHEFTKGVLGIDFNERDIYPVAIGSSLKRDKSEMSFKTNLKSEKSEIFDRSELHERPKRHVKSEIFDKMDVSEVFGKPDRPMKSDKRGKQPVNEVYEEEEEEEEVEESPKEFEKHNVCEILEEEEEEEELEVLKESE